MPVTLEGRHCARSRAPIAGRCTARGPIGIVAGLLIGCAPVAKNAPPEPRPEPAVREVRVPYEVVVKVPEVSVEDRAARDFLAYFERVRRMPPSELSREFARLDAPQGAQAIVEFALALGQTRSPNDTVRALGLLDPLLRSNDPAAAPWQPLARLLSTRLAEQRRLEDQVERQNQQLRESQRRQDQLNQQLEALKAIERSLTTRPTGGASAPAAGRRP